MGTYRLTVMLGALSAICQALQTPLLKTEDAEISFKLLAVRTALVDLYGELTEKLKEQAYA